MMNLLKVVVSLFFITVAFAQSAYITYPPDGATVPAGQNLTVQIERPDTLTGSQEVAIVIGLTYCNPTSGCPPPVDVMGNILYNGPYSPMFHEPPAPPYGPYQNFSVLIPSGTTGPAQINVAHVTLIGAGAFPFLETLNTSITIGY